MAPVLTKEMIERNRFYVNHNGRITEAMFKNLTVCQPRICEVNPASNGFAGLFSYTILFADESTPINVQAIQDLDTDLYCSVEDCIVRRNSLRGAVFDYHEIMEGFEEVDVRGGKDWQVYIWNKSTLAPVPCTLGKCIVENLTSYDLLHLKLANGKKIYKTYEECAEDNRQVSVVHFSSMTTYVDLKLLEESLEDEKKSPVKFIYFE